MASPEPFAGSTLENLINPDQSPSLASTRSLQPSPESSNEKFSLTSSQVSPLLTATPSPFSPAGFAQFTLFANLADKSLSYRLIEANSNTELQKQILSDACDACLSKPKHVEIPDLLQQLARLSVGYPWLLDGMIEQRQFSRRFLLALVDEADQNESLREKLKQSSYQRVWVEELTNWGYKKGQKLQPQKNLDPVDHIIGCRLTGKACDIFFKDKEATGKENYSFACTDLLIRAARFGSFEALRKLAEIFTELLESEQEISVEYRREIYELFKQAALLHKTPGHILASTICLALATYCNKHLLPMSEVTEAGKEKQNLYDSQSLLYYEYCYLHLLCALRLKDMSKVEITNCYSITPEQFPELALEDVTWDNPAVLKQVFSKGTASYYQAPPVESLSELFHAIYKLYFLPIVNCVKGAPKYEPFVAAVDLRRQAETTDIAMQRLVESPYKYSSSCKMGAKS